MAGAWVGRKGSNFTSLVVTVDLLVHVISGNLASGIFPKLETLISLGSSLPRQPKEPA